jgi:hypothetical protein
MRVCLVDACAELVVLLAGARPWLLRARLCHVTHMPRAHHPAGAVSSHGPVLSASMVHAKAAPHRPALDRCVTSYAARGSSNNL